MAPPGASHFIRIQLSFGELYLAICSLSGHILTLWVHSRYAIKGSPTGKLLLEDIYYAIESRVCTVFQRVPLLTHVISSHTSEQRHLAGR